MGWGDYGGSMWGEYVPVARRKANAVKLAKERAKKAGRKPAPVTPNGLGGGKKKLASTFWGQAWCDNLESYRDYANRLPRGATYLRNGSVVDLDIRQQKIEAIVAGSEPYDVTITIQELASSVWKQIQRDCSQSIDSLLDLLSGKFSEGVMRRLTRQKDGLFPAPQEIAMECSCPDGSYLCKHLAAVMYGVGLRLDEQPKLLFLLRGVDPQQLTTLATGERNLEKELSGGVAHALAGEDLGALFGIELETPAAGKAAKKKAAAPKASSMPSPVTNSPVTKSVTKSVKKSVKKTPIKKNEIAAAILKKIRNKTSEPAAKKAAVKKATVKKRSAK